MTLPAVPGLDRSRIHDLTAGILAPGGADEFLHSYLLMLPDRIARIMEAFRLRNAETAMDAVLSLKASSDMAGARLLESYCRILETRLRAGEIPVPESVGPCLDNAMYCVLDAA